MWVKHSPGLEHARASTPRASHRPRAHKGSKWQLGNKAPARTRASCKSRQLDRQPTREVAAAPSTPARASQGGDTKRPRNRAARLEPEKSSSGSSARAPPRPHKRAAAAPRGCTGGRLPRYSLPGPLLCSGEAPPGSSGAFACSQPRGWWEHGATSAPELSRREAVEDDVGNEERATLAAA